jgi:hypothetical protein
MHKCDFCQKEKEVELIGNNFVCESCYEKICLNEASLEAYDQWIQAVVYSNGYDNLIDHRIKEILENIDRESFDFEIQRKMLLSNLEDEIKSRLQYYHKDELFVAFFTVREIIRRKLLVEKEKMDWIEISDISAINILIRLTNDIKKFENHPFGELENNCSNFANAVCYARRYNIITENMSLSFGNITSLSEICFEPIQTEDTEKYFDIYLKNGLDEKPEDYIIENEILNRKMETEGKTPNAILNALDSLLIKEFGFSRADYQRLNTALFHMEFPKESDYWGLIGGKKKLFVHFPIFMMEKSLLEEICQREMLQAILNTFSINRNIHNHKNADELELFCFYETDNFIIFGNFDFSQTMSAFEKFLLSGDYIDIYKENFSKNKAVSKAQRNLSKYFSACVSEYLFNHGYKLPMENYLNNSIPRAEIEKIEVNGKNILTSDTEASKKLGDIDVLALNPLKKELLLFELKFYKPAISSKDMLFKDKSKIVDKDVLRHMKEREEVVASNVDEVVKFILGEYQYGYKVRSILLTARTNFHGIKEKFDYLTWSEFLEKVDTNEL